MQGSSRPTPQDLGEVLAIASALRAHVEWQRELGATGLPASLRAHAARGADAGPSAVAPRSPAGVSAVAPTPPAGADASALAPTPPAGADASARVASPGAVGPASASEKPDAARRHLRLAELADEIRGCQKCALSRGRTQTVFARGNPQSELCFVGEGPGADEDAQGLPFVGKAGQLLDRMIYAMGYARDDVYICNIVKCRPPDNRKPLPEEMAACVPYLSEQLSLVSPRTIVALGATAVEGLLGVSGGITRLRGQWRLYRGSIPVMPTFHPAYLLRNPAAKREVWEDLKAVLKQLGRPVPPAGR